MTPCSPGSQGVRGGAPGNSGAEADNDPSTPEANARILIFVFASFIFGGTRVIEEVGIGFASAILLDAFVLRTVLVPALMHLFGRANWWLPGWLDRILPTLNVEPADLEAPEPLPEPVG
jgi:RND superfamily putative drug exporter